MGMVAAGVFPEETPLWVQMLAGVSIAGVGIAIGGSIGLIAWLARVLADPPEMELPDVGAAPQGSGEAASL